MDIKEVAKSLRTLVDKLDRIGDEDQTPIKTKLTHRDEYKLLQDETKLYQHEMHRTWLWGTIAPAAVYTWLASPTSNNYHNPPLCVWCIPPILVLFCAIRYVGFKWRIALIGEYVDLIEEDEFTTKEKLRGFGFHQKRQNTLSHRFCFRIAYLLWFLLFVGAAVLSFCGRSQMSSVS